MDASPPDFARISFVTMHYADLRAGVGRAVVIPCILAAGAIEFGLEEMRVGKGPHVVLGVLNLFGMAALAVWLWARNRRWLDAKFGRVQGSVWRGQTWLGLVAYASLFDVTLAPAGMVPAKFLVIAACGLWLVARLRPHGFHYLLPAAAALAATATFMNVTSEAAREQWELYWLGGTFLAWTVAGLIDLVILFKVLPPGGTSSVAHHANAI